MAACGETQLLHEPLRLVQMLDHVEQENLVVARNIDGKFGGLEIPGDGRNIGGGSGGRFAEVGDVASASSQFGGEIGFGATDVEDLAAGPGGGECEGMRGRVIELEFVGAARGIHVELAVVKQVHLVDTGAEHRLENVPRVFDAIDAADLVAVVGGDGQFADAQPGQHELDDDLGVEMEIVGVALERNLFERVDRVEPVAGMELGEVRAEERVLEPGQHFVAEEFVKGHPALARPAPGHHAGTEHGVGFPGDQRGEQFGQALGGILAVAVDQRDEIETVFDGVAVAEFLVAAVTLVFGVAQDGDGEAAAVTVAGGVVDAGLEGVVG